MSGDFSAREPMLGYLYQVRYALLLLLQAKDEAGLSVETLDDVAFETGGRPSDLLQLKHHCVPGSLTDASPDLWKTIRVWASAVSDGSIPLDHVILTLITTASTPPTSIAARLVPGKDRDVVSACKDLRAVAAVSKNDALDASFAAFAALSPSVQEQLVAKIHVLTGALDITGLADVTRKELRLSTRPQYVALLHERLEGWWFAKIVEHLRHSVHTTIKGFELRDHIVTLA